MLSRALFLDEALLLKNIVEAGFTDLFKPFAYYSQAQPVVLSFIHKFIIEFISIELHHIRLIVLIITLVPVIYTLYRISKFHGIDFKTNGYYTWHHNRQRRVLSH